jgi:hypothetical protein
MAYGPKKNLSPLPAGKYGKSTKISTRRRHQVNKGKSGFEAEGVRPLGALCSLRCTMNLAVEKRHETHFSSNDNREKWIEDFVERETAVARKRVQDAETAIMQDLTTAANGSATPRKPKTTFQAMLNAIRGSLSDLACSDD